MHEETIEDIVAEMRQGVRDTFGNIVSIYDDFADRIEAAYRRENRSNNEDDVKLEEIAIPAHAIFCKENGVDENEKKLLAQFALYLSACYQNVKVKIRSYEAWQG